MWPRSCDRGKVNSCPNVCQFVPSLQCGRGHATAENAQRAEISAGLRGASMWPRSCDRGKAALVRCFLEMAPDTNCERRKVIEHGRPQLQKVATHKADELTGLSTSRAGRGKWMPLCRSRTKCESGKAAPVPIRPFGPARRTTGSASDRAKTKLDELSKNVSTTY